MIKKIYVKTDYVPEDCSYITAGKLYGFFDVDEDNEFGSIIPDSNIEARINVNCCHHLRGRSWQVIEKYIPEIGDECVFSNVEHMSHSTVRVLEATTSDGRFVDDYDVLWVYCEPVVKKKKKVLKKASEIIKWCEDHDYRYTYIGYINNNNNNLPNFYFGELEFCGKEPDSILNYHEDWLEEV